MNDITKTLIEGYGLEAYFPFGPMITTSVCPIGIVDKINQWCDTAFENPVNEKDVSSTLAGVQSEELQLPEKLCNEIGLSQWLVDHGKAYYELYNNKVGEWNKHYTSSARPISGLQIRSVWVNKALAGDFNPPHIHVGDLTGILYLQFPQEILEEQLTGKKADDNWHKNKSNGATQILSPIQIGHFMNNPRLEIGNPQPGMFIVFPCWLYHQVMPFMAKGAERRTLSFNLDFKINEMHNKD